MNIEKAEFVGTIKLSGQEEREGYTSVAPQTDNRGLPIPPKPGVDVHLVLGGDYVLLRERLPPHEGNAPKVEPACILVPRERVKRLIISAKQAAELLKGDR